MHEQIRLYCTIMRGGTSKAIFIKKNELPADPELRDQMILAIFGSPDVRQIDGLGGSDITTSKVAIIGPPTRDDADIDYNFGQVQLKTAEIIWNSNCGNISSAVGPYAIDEGMVRTTEPVTKVRIHNVNTNKILIENVPVKNGQAVVEGDYVLDGVPGTGARLDLDYADTAGAVTGKLLPTGRALDILDVPGLGKIEASIVDIANSVCFIDAASVGAKGTESPPDIRADKDLMAKLEAVRNAAALKCGYIREGEIALEKSPIQPLISFVSPAVDYRDYGSGAMIKEKDTDFLARILFNQLPTDTFPGTATVCIATAAMIEGTVVNRVRKPGIKDQNLVRFGHARGVNKVNVEVENTLTGPIVKSVLFSRTARRIMDGVVYVKRSRVFPAFESHES
jgi:2-methylaconitate cis-trans-isomerase PrpF